MAEIVDIINSVLGVSLTLGSTTLTLGGVVLGAVGVMMALRFFKSLSRGR